MRNKETKRSVTIIEVVTGILVFIAFFAYDKGAQAFWIYACLALFTFFISRRGIEKAWGYSIMLALLSYFSNSFLAPPNADYQGWDFLIVMFWAIGSIVVALVSNIIWRYGSKFMREYRASRNV